VARGWRDPEHPRDRAGTEPATARSPLALRAVLAVIAIVSAVAAAVLVSIFDAGGSPAWLVTLMLVVAVVSAVDLVVVLGRIRRHDRG
jgi:membrane protein YdbS with pleckstrin-like domain